MADDSEMRDRILLELAKAAVGKEVDDAALLKGVALGDSPPVAHKLEHYLDELSHEFLIIRSPHRKSQLSPSGRKYLVLKRLI